MMLKLSRKILRGNSEKSLGRKYLCSEILRRALSLIKKKKERKEKQKDISLSLDFTGDTLQIFTIWTAR